MVGQVASLDYVVTDNEVEALILESNYIKRHKPKYNIVLRDDKNYPYLRFTTQEPYPQLEIVRGVKRDGASYFGPYVSAKSIRRTLRLIHKIFPIRQCVEPIDGRRERPCLEYQMKRCIAPCVGYCSKGEYDRLVEEVTLFLRGRDRDLLKGLLAKMETASEDLRYEEAARYRDQVRAIERVVERQRIISTGLEDQDVVGLHRFGNKARIQVFFVRGGKVLGDRGFDLRYDVGEDSRELLASFLKQYYSQGAFVPPEILLEAEVPDRELIEDWLSGLRGGRVELQVPQRGKKAHLLRMAQENARFFLENPLEAGPSAGDLLEELREVLRLRETPRRIEAFDISNIQGQEAVGSMVVFFDGRPRKDEYRHYIIRREGRPDDYAMMEEVLDRRFRRAIQEGGPWPQLVLVDGGKGQLQVALRVLESLALAYIPVLALAKGENRRGRNDLIYLPGIADPVPLLPDSPVRYLLQRVRDETHRFAVTFHRKRRGRAQIRSLLDEVPGIGPARRASLLRYFGSLEEVREATVEALAGIPHMTQALAQAVKERLGGSP
jgi:excinuclease ABC subunit C